MDICSMTKTQFFTLRDRDGTAFAILEAPVTACAEGVKLAELHDMTRFQLDSRYSFSEWSGRIEGDRIFDLQIKFSWRNFQCIREAPSGSVAFLTEGRYLHLDPISIGGATNALILGYLDYFRAVEMHKVSSDGALKIEFEYVGKAEADQGWPSLHFIDDPEPVVIEQETQKLLPELDSP